MRRSTFVPTLEGCERRIALDGDVLTEAPAEPPADVEDIDTTRQSVLEGVIGDSPIMPGTDLDFVPEPDPAETIEQLRDELINQDGPVITDEELDELLSPAPEVEVPWYEPVIDFIDNAIDTMMDVEIPVPDGFGPYITQ